MGGDAKLKTLFVWPNRDFAKYAFFIIESSRDGPDSPLMQYITNAGISRARYTITHFKHHPRVLWLISNRMSV